MGWRDDCRNLVGREVGRRVMRTSPFSFTFSSSWSSCQWAVRHQSQEEMLTLYGAYHLARRVFPL